MPVYRHPIAGKIATCSEEEWERHGYKARGYVLVEDKPAPELKAPPKPKKEPKLKPGYDPDEIG